MGQYGFTVSYNFKGIKGRQRQGMVYRTKREATAAAKKANKGFASISGARAVAATEREYRSR